MSGMHQDLEPIRQPKGTYRFAQNVVFDKENNIITEPSALNCLDLEGYKIIGSVYVGDNETVLFLSNGITSKISVFNHCTLKDEVIFDKLNFNEIYPIKAVYRLRNGCDKTIYWTDGFNPPRYYIIGKRNLFEDASGNLDIDKFNLLANFNVIPNIDIEVIEGAGALPPGSYNVAIQYVDANLNATTFANISDTVIIYNDNKYSDIKTIRGSNKTDILGNDFPKTSKAIRVKVSNLDSSFEYYRVIIIEATDGTGIPTSVKYSKLLPISEETYIYTGNNYKYEGSYDEIFQTRLNINNVETIEHIENRLVLGNVSVDNNKNCELQRYASLINADCVVYKVDMENIEDFGNTKNPELHLNRIGYQPGEIYSFGIVYIYEDGTKSPVYHIPGKNPALGASHIFDTSWNGNGDPDFVGIYGMDINNELTNIKYIGGDNCSLNYYEDSTGEQLLGKPVRHHRFPLRKDIGVPLVDKKSEKYGEYIKRCVRRKFSHPPSPNSVEVKVIIEYEINGIRKTYTKKFKPNEYFPAWEICIEEYTTTGVINILKIIEEEKIKTGVGLYTYIVNNNAIALYIIHQQTKEDLYRDVYVAYVFGIHFSNIIIPPKSVSGKNIIGYYIVRNERDETTETIVDSAIVSTGIYHDSTFGIGLLMPNRGITGDNGDCDIWFNWQIYQIISPRILSKNINISNNYGTIQQGYYYRDDEIRGLFKEQDVAPGSSYNPEEDKNKYEDTDGWDLKVITRDNRMRFSLSDETDKCECSGFNYSPDNIDDISILEPYEEKIVYYDYSNKNISVVNYSVDNRLGVIKLKDPIPLFKGDDCLPYIYIYRDLEDPYANFSDLPYFKCHTNYIDASKSSADIFGGDTYISPLRMCSMLFYGARNAKRCKKSGIGQILVGVLNIGLGTVLISSGQVNAGIDIISIGLGFITTGIAIQTFKNRYYKNFEPELAKKVTDCWVRSEYEYLKFPASNRPETGCDDELQWIADFLTTIWFESKINFALRYGKIVDDVGILDAPDNVEYTTQREEKEHRCNYKVNCTKEENKPPVTKIQKYARKKLFARTSSGEEYAHIAHLELYNINPDYQRRNKEEVYFAIPISYDCCSECIESFPHRIYYSQQSFQEERNDNYRVFLPNNYIDIEGDSGKITNLFRMSNRLYIHTEYGLWVLPPSIQERVNRDIVTFIGTGEFFSIPPRKIIESNILGGGLSKHTHFLKTREGIFFVSIHDRKIYQFTGQNLIPISDNGVKNVVAELLSDNLEIKRVSYISIGYDPYFSRILFTIVNEKPPIFGGEVELVERATLSFSTKLDGWVSYHTYFPKYYFNDNRILYSYDDIDKKIYFHTNRGSYRQFYRGIIYPTIIEEVYKSYPVPKVINDILFDTDAFYERDITDDNPDLLSDITFNKAIIYNSKQCTGIIELITRKEEDHNYMDVRIKENNQSLLERRERFWSINDIRNKRSSFDESMWLLYLRGNTLYEWSDKILNPTQFGTTLNWTDKGYFIDKFVISRLIFDIKNKNIKLVYRLHFVEDTTSLR